jgi:hypothetical protein
MGSRRVVIQLMIDRIYIKLNKIGEMLTVNDKTIERLTEYRTSIITAAITGKIDIRYFKILKSQGAAND